MVLWELTLATAYFLGLKRTYKRALRLQRRLISPKYPKIRQFAYKYTRNVFDVAVAFHKKVQQRDIEVGRNLGNWILRWLDRKKPSAKIRLPKEPSCNSDISKNVTSSGPSLGSTKTNIKPAEKETKGRLHFSPLNIRPKGFSTVSMMIKSRNLASFNSQYTIATPFTTYASRLEKGSSSFKGVFRDDIAQWMLHQ